jgi:hypothetical protein
MKWAVEVQRTTLDRRNLEDLLVGLGFSLRDGVQFPVLASPELDQCNSAVEVFAIAKKVRDTFRGPAQIDPQFTLGSVEDYSSMPPRRHAFLEVQTAVQTITMCTATLTVGPPAGLSPEELEAWRRDREEQEYQSRLDAQRKRLEPAYSEPRAAKVLEYLATTAPRAEVVYKIYELIEEHPDYRTAFQAKFGISANEFKRFKDAVHNPAVSGDWARHAYLDTPKTPNPMSKSEAESFVRTLADRWLAHIRTGLPP